MTEIWKSIAGYEGLYEVSNLGNVRGMSGKQNGKCGPKKSRIVKDYLLVRLWKNGVPHDVGVHVLVATAFIGERPDGMLCCHNDGDRMNNVSSNLRWDTPKGNSADRIKHGTHIGGENNGRAVLTEECVRKIKLRIRDTDDKLKDIAREFGVSAGTISHIKHGRKWTEVSI